MANGKRLSRLLQLMSASERARFLSRRSFSHQLQIKHGQIGSYTSFDDNQLVFEYEVPERVCTGMTSMGTTLPLTSLLAIVDETTTWASIGLDPRRRPGVSVCLSAQMIRRQHVAPGETLFFRSQLLKLGKTIGFLECEVASATGVIASCTHIKYLEMGRAWDLMMGSPLFPLTRTLLVSPTSQAAPALAPTVGDLLVLTSLPKAGEDGHAFMFDCNADNMNELGVLHGGCQSMMHGTACEAAAIADGASSLLLHDAHIHYFSAGTRGRIEARVTRLASSPHESRYVSRLYASGSSKPISQATLHYVPG